MSLLKKIKLTETVNDIHGHWVTACKKGSRDAQFQLYQLYAKNMLNISYRIVNDQMTAEDVVQESFVSAFRSISSFKGDCTFGSWLKKIVVNKSITALRKNIKWENTTEYMAVHTPIFTSEESEEWTVEKIKKAMSQLSDGFRTVLTLYLFEGYDHEEIAQILSISSSTSKTQYMRAKLKLKEILTS